MQLTKHTDYAFRVLIYLANMQEEKTTISHITERFAISKTHLMKVVNILSNAGWVTSVRGKNGGIYLGIAPEDLSLRAVVERMENILEPVNCQQPVCFFDGVCHLKGVLFQAQEAYLAHIGQYSLADLIRPELQQRLYTDVGVINFKPDTPT